MVYIKRMNEIEIKREGCSSWGQYGKRGVRCKDLEVRGRSVFS